jgi:DNA-binding GntR family transcriptional regulator
MMESTRLVLEFHEYILNLSGNSRLVATISGIVAFPVLYRAQRSYSQSRLHEGHAEHRLLVEALREHDGELAEAIMRQHIMAARAEERRLFRLMAEERPG